jgi:hypothetical protein
MVYIIQGSIADNNTCIFRTKSTDKQTHKVNPLYSPNFVVGSLKIHNLFRHIKSIFRFSSPPAPLKVPHLIVFYFLKKSKGKKICLNWYYRIQKIEHIMANVLVFYQSYTLSFNFNHICNLKIWKLTKNKKKTKCYQKNTKYIF